MDLRKILSSFLAAFGLDLAIKLLYFSLYTAVNSRTFTVIADAIITQVTR